MAGQDPQAAISQNESKTIRIQVVFEILTKKAEILEFSIQNVVQNSVLARGAPENSCIEKHLFTSVFERKICISAKTDPWTPSD